MSQQPNTRADAKNQASRSSGGSGSRSRGRTWFRRGLWTLLALFVAGVAAIGVAYAMTEVPQPNEIATAEASIVYYADGTSEMARLSDPEGNRESVPLSEISEDMQHAILAAEEEEGWRGGSDP